MHGLAFAPHLDGFDIQILAADAEHVEMRVVATAPQAACPVCHQLSSRVHSRYERQVADLPWSHARVVLRVLARRFRCLTAACPRRIFCERLPGLVAVYARSTEVLTALLRVLGFALGGRPAVRLADRLPVLVSRTTLLRLVRSAAEPPPPRAPRVLSMDEWVYRRGRADGLILLDLEQHRVLDLLPDASAATVATWLRTHPGVEVFSRDRSGSFAEAARQAAPEAVQIADRFHLLRNLGRVAEWVLRRHATLIGCLPVPDRTSLPTTVLRPDRQVSRDRTRARLQDLLTAIQRLKARGATRSSAARALGVNRKTVLKYWTTAEAPERRHWVRGTSALTPYEPYVREQWQQGEHNAMQLWREVRERGYVGVYQNVARYVAALKRLDRAGASCSAPPRAGLTVRHVVALALRRPEKRSGAKRAVLRQAKRLDPEVGHVLAVLEDFASLVRRRPVAHPAAQLDAWEEHARALRAPELTTFLTRLKQDRSAIEAALVLPYSQGQTERQITRLKALKRAMFGRSTFDLLRKRFLAGV